MPAKKTGRKKQAPQRKGLGGAYVFGERELAVLEELAEIQCTQGEMAAVLGISRETLNARIKDTPEVATAINKGQESGKSSLRRLQWKLAQKNVGMAIWLGKQWLNQVDRQELQLGDLPAVSVNINGRTS